MPFDESQAKVSLIPATSEDTAHQDRWECIAEVSLEPKAKVLAIFTALSEGTLNPQKEWEQYGYGVLELLGPPAYRAFVDSMHSRLSDLAHRCISLIQWRLVVSGSHRPLQGGRRLRWSMDGNSWEPVPGVAGAEASHASSLRDVKEPIYGQISEMLAKDRSQPLGHELLRESIMLRRSGGERSAFVVAVMAAEVGVKQCLIDLLPQTEWLLTNIQSPPLPRLIEELLPTVPIRGDGKRKVFPVPDSLLKAIKSACGIRNDIVHKGNHPLAAERLNEVIQAVRDLLYRLDYLQGDQWAVEGMWWESFSDPGSRG